MVICASQFRRWCDVLRYQQCQSEEQDPSEASATRTVTPWRCTAVSYNVILQSPCCILGTCYRYVPMLRRRHTLTISSISRLLHAYEVSVHSAALYSILINKSNCTDVTTAALPHYQRPHCSACAARVLSVTDQDRYDSRGTIGPADPLLVSWFTSI